MKRRTAPTIVTEYPLMMQWSAPPGGSRLDKAVVSTDRRNTLVSLMMLKINLIAPARCLDGAFWRDMQAAKEKGRTP
jgi:hypothetical protein